ncbi:GtrA family protein [Amorphus sp. 3PC139-8]|uniref:GtrA family protein n=1 Tax=Amorphus sp. 3PC139-8 TaxID=2735676 RepID=UPI00345CB7D9
MPTPSAEHASQTVGSAFGGLRRIFRFLVTGGTGFVVDAGVLSLVMWLTSVGPIWARCVSFPVALLVTWLMNRSWSFGDRQRPRFGAELAGYVGIQVIGFLVNSGIYVVLIAGWIGLTLPPLAALFLGSGTSAFVTFVLMNARLYGQSR